MRRQKLLDIFERLGSLERAEVTRAAFLRKLHGRLKFLESLYHESVMAHLSSHRRLPALEAKAADPVKPPKPAREPCPCGNGIPGFVHVENGSFLRCPKCGTTSKFHSNLGDVARAWNAMAEKAEAPAPVEWDAAIKMQFSMPVNWMAAVKVPGCPTCAKLRKERPTPECGHDDCSYRASVMCTAEDVIWCLRADKDRLKLDLAAKDATITDLRVQVGVVSGKLALREYEKGGLQCLTKNKSKDAHLSGPAPTARTMT